MITKSPYGFGYGHKGRIAGTEPEPGPRLLVRHPDPQAVIDCCLNCTKEKCTGECQLTPAGKIKAKYKNQTQARIERMKRAEELERKQTEEARAIADMVLVGWCESAIAREKGFSVDEVKGLIKVARKKGFLY